MSLAAASNSPPQYSKSNSPHKREFHMTQKFIKQIPDEAFFSPDPNSFLKKNISEIAAQEQFSGLLLAGAQFLKPSSKHFQFMLLSGVFDSQEQQLPFTENTYIVFRYIESGSWVVQPLVEPKRDKSPDSKFIDDKKIGQRHFSFAEWSKDLSIDGLARSTYSGPPHPPPAAAIGQQWIDLLSRTDTSHLLKSLEVFVLYYTQTSNSVFINSNRNSKANEPDHRQGHLQNSSELESHSGKLFLKLVLRSAHHQFDSKSIEMPFWGHILQTSPNIQGARIHKVEFSEKSLKDGVVSQTKKTGQIEFRINLAAISNKLLEANSVIIFSMKNFRTNPMTISLK